MRDKNPFGLMDRREDPPPGLPTEQLYLIKVEPQLDSHWANWFDGWSMTSVKDGTTLLVGMVQDQAALHGLLAKIRNLNLSLISLCRVHCSQAEGLHYPFPS